MSQRNRPRQQNSPSSRPSSSRLQQAQQHSSPANAPQTAPQQQQPSSGVPSEFPTLAGSALNSGHASPIMPPHAIIARMGDVGASRGSWSHHNASGQLLGDDDATGVLLMQLRERYAEIRVCSPGDISWAMLAEWVEASARQIKAQIDHFSRDPSDASEVREMKRQYETFLAAQNALSNSFCSPLASATPSSTAIATPLGTTGTVASAADGCGSTRSTAPHGSMLLSHASSVASPRSVPATPATHAHGQAQGQANGGSAYNTRRAAGANSARAPHSTRGAIAGGNGMPGLGLLMTPAAGMAEMSAAAAALNGGGIAMGVSTPNTPLRRAGSKRKAASATAAASASTTDAAAAASSCAFTSSAVSTPTMGAMSYAFASAAPFSAAGASANTAAHGDSRVGGMGLAMIDNGASVVEAGGDNVNMSVRMDDEENGTAVARVGASGDEDGDVVDYDYHHHHHAHMLQHTGYPTRQEQQQQQQQQLAQEQVRRSVSAHNQSHAQTQQHALMRATSDAVREDDEDASSVSDIRTRAHGHAHGQQQEHGKVKSRVRAQSQMQGCNHGDDDSDVEEARLVQQQQYEHQQQQPDYYHRCSTLCHPATCPHMAHDQQQQQQYEFFVMQQQQQAAAAAAAAAAEAQAQAEAAAAAAAAEAAAAAAIEEPRMEEFPLDATGLFEGARAYSAHDEIHRTNLGVIIKGTRRLFPTSMRCTSLVLNTASQPNLQWLTQVSDPDHGLIVRSIAHAAAAASNDHSYASLPAHEVDEMFRYKSIPGIPANMAVLEFEFAPNANHIVTHITVGALSVSRSSGLSGVVIESSHDRVQWAAAAQVSNVDDCPVTLRLALPRSAPYWRLKRSRSIEIGYLSFEQQVAIKKSALSSVRAPRSGDSPADEAKFYRALTGFQYTPRVLEELFGPPEDPTNHWIVSEFMGGRDVYHLLNENRDVRDLRMIPEDDVAMLFAQVALSVYYMHHVKKVCHLDLKPANILLSREKTRACVSDFGVMHVMQDTASHGLAVLGRTRRGDPLPRDLDANDLQECPPPQGIAPGDIITHNEPHALENIVGIFGTKDYMAPEIISLYHTTQDAKRAAEEQANQAAQAAAAAVLAAERNGSISRPPGMSAEEFNAEIDAQAEAAAAAARANAPRRDCIECGHVAHLYGLCKPHWRRRYGFDGRKADVYSLGVILFTMLTKVPPYLGFASQNNTHYAALARHGPGYLVNAYRSQFPNINVSADALDLMTRMVKADPSQRFFIEDVIQHRWVASRIARLLPTPQ